MDEVKKEVKSLDNQNFKERFQFILSVNDNIICQRYFKINWFAFESVESKEFVNVMRECVDMIKNDLVSKSRVYMAYTNNTEPIKLTGFIKDTEKYPSEFISSVVGNVIHYGAYRRATQPTVLPNVVTWSTSAVEEYKEKATDLSEMQYPLGETVEHPNNDDNFTVRINRQKIDRTVEDGTEKPFVRDLRDYRIEETTLYFPVSEEEHTDDTDSEHVFKFAFLIDDKPYYEEVWDGNIYPKYVRNSVDLTNSDAQYRGKEPSSLHFSLAIIRHLNNGRKDLVYHIIKKICDVCSSAVEKDAEGNVNVQKKEYTKSESYGKDKDGKTKTYHFTNYPKSYINGWRKAVLGETLKYERWLNHDYSEEFLNRINRK